MTTITIDRSVVEQALKLHEAQIVNENYDYDGCFQHWDDHITLETLVETYRAALAEQPAEQQEPVYSIEHLDKAYELGFSEGVKAAPQPAKPAERVPLTDDEIDVIVVDVLGLDADEDAMQDFARAIEAAVWGKK